MEPKDFELTLLSEKDLVGEEKLDTILTNGADCGVTDFAILTGACPTFTYSFDGRGINKCSSYATSDGIVNNQNIRLKIKFNSEKAFNEFMKDREMDIDNTICIAYFPQYLVESFLLTETLENYYEKSHETTIQIAGVSYMRVKLGNDITSASYFYLSNGLKPKGNGFYWVIISPIKWYVDKESQSLICSVVLYSDELKREASPYYQWIFNQVYEQIQRGVSRNRKTEEE